MTRLALESGGAGLGWLGDNDTVRYYAPAAGVLDSDGAGGYQQLPFFQN
jgi:hypothetical protein